MTPLAARVARVLMALPLAWGCARNSLPDLGSIPDFALTERAGRVVQATDLAGSVWIANFVFTHCPDVCPALTQQMAALQRQFSGPAGEGIRLVSISADPARDSPEVLRTYAAAAGAGERWWFLTGTRDAVGRLLRDGFHVGWADDGPGDAPITHTDRFVLVDRQRRIRGYYHGQTPGDLRRLASDALALAGAPSP